MAGINNILGNIGGIEENTYIYGDSKVEKAAKHFFIHYSRHSKVVTKKKQHYVPLCHL